MKECQDCPSLNTAKCVVPGVGPQTPGGIVFVGEAPGREEDEEGKPFVGGSGKILRSLIHEAGMNPKEIYFTNTVKCRPPNNRQPEVVEIKRCLPKLIEELKALQPRLIVALGVVASSVLTARDLVWRGSIIPCVQSGLEHVPVLITFHPAYLMRNRTEFSTVLNDLLKINNPPKKYSQSYQANPPIEWVKAEFERFKHEKLPVAVDIETSGKYTNINFFEDTIIGIAFCQTPGVAFSLDFRGDTSPYWPLVKAFLESSCPVVLQNNTFDLFMLLNRKGIQVKTLEWDTLDAMYVLYSDSDKDLDHLRSIYTSLPPYKHIYRTKGIGNLTQEELNIYNCLDVDVTLQVSIGQKGAFTPKQTEVVKTILKADLLCTKMKKVGVGVSKDTIARHYLELKPLVDRLQGEFELKHHINPGSPQQVSKFLFTTRGLPIPPRARTKTGFSVDVEILKEVKSKCFVTEDVLILDELLEYRKRSRELSTNVEGLYKLIEPSTGRIHPDWKPTGTDTGRWACKKPNMQNVPKHMRDIFVPREGYEYFISDYSQLEMLTIAILAEDWDLVEAITTGRDIHGETNVEMNKIIPTTRTVTKAFVFGTAYGMGLASASRLYSLPMPIAKQLQELCYNKFPKLLKYSEKNLKDWERDGYLDTPFGRRKYCESPNQALNFKSQSTGFCIVQEGMFKLDEARWNISFQVHDEIVCEEPIGTRTEEEYKAIVETPYPAFIPKFPVKVRKAQTWMEDKD